MNHYLPSIGIIFLGLMTHLLHGADSPYKLDRLREYNQQISHYEKKLNNLDRHKVYKIRRLIESKKKKEPIKINRYLDIENCFLGVASEAFKDGKQVLLEQGPINLRKVESISDVSYEEDHSMGWAVRFNPLGSENFPRLFFSSERSRKKGKEILVKLNQLCRARYEVYSSIAPKDDSLEIPEGKPSFAPSGITKTKFDSEQDPMRGALLTNGHKSFSARLGSLAELQGPDNSLFIQTLTFSADEGGSRLAKGLMEKARLGVKIEVMIDSGALFFDLRDMKLRRNTHKMYHNLMASGVPVYGYRCGLNKHKFYDEVKLSIKYKKKLINHRSHEKIWLINKKKAILGGMNIGNEYFRLNPKGKYYWRDQDIMIEGERLSQDIYNIFRGNAKTYEASYLSPFKDSCYNSYDPIKEPLKYEEFRKTHWKDYSEERKRHEKKEVRSHALEYVSYLETNRDYFKDELEDSFVPLTRARVIQNRPKLKELYIEEAYLSLINSARKEVIISNAYFIPSEKMKRAIRRAAKRGVKVHILTNSYETNDVSPSSVLSRYSYKELVDYSYRSDIHKSQENNVAIYEWQGVNQLTQEKEQGTIHAKFMVVDQKYLIVGSYNLDPRARLLNSEIAVVVEDRDQGLAKELAHEFFNEDLKYAHKLNYKDILIARKPVGPLKAIKLKLKGYRVENSIYDKLGYSFFTKIARYDETLW